MAGRSRDKKQAAKNKKSSSVPPKKSDNPPESNNVPPEEPPKSEELEKPIVSPVDPNHYRIIQLKNKMRAILVSTLGHATELAQEELKDEESQEHICENRTDTSVFNRDRRRRRGQNSGDDEPPISPSKSNPCEIIDDDDISDFDLEHQSPHENPRGGSIMDQMIGGTEKPGSSNEPPPTESTGDESSTDDEETHTWLPEVGPEDEKVLQRFCGIMKRKSTMVEFAINAAAGSIFDPPGVPGRAVLAREILARGIAKSGNGILYFSHDYTHAEHATIKFRTKTMDLEKKLAFVGEQLSKIVSSKKYILQKIDDMDWNEEFLQCRYCWYNPMTDWRRTTLLVSLAKEEHPIRNISPGDPTKLWDLEENASNELEGYIHRFIQDKYVGANMTFAIRAPESLDTLDKWVTTAFNDLPEGIEQTSQGDTDPFDTEEFRKFYTVHCSNPHCCDQGDSYVIITFPLPAEIGQNYQVKPLDYYNELLTYGGHGGLCAYLREHNLGLDVKTNCTGCDGSGVQSNAYATLFEIQVTLDEEGLKKVDQVIEAVFAYLKFIRTSGPFKKFYDEMKETRSVNFHALEREVSLKDPFPTHVARLSMWLRYFAPKDVMVAPFLLMSFDEEVINSVAEKLVPENANYMLCVCPNNDDINEGDGVEIEPLFQTKYHAVDLTDEQLTMWQNVSVPSGAFNPPEPNRFIPDFYFQSCMEEVESKDVILYKDNNPAKIWYQQDDSWGHFSVYFVHVVTPASYNGPANSINLKLWCLILQDQLIPLTHAAGKAQIGFDLQATHYGLMISLYSWNNKIEDVLDVILSQIADFGAHPVDGVFHRMKTALLKDMAADTTHEYWSNYYMANEIFDALREIDSWTCFDMDRELKAIEYGDLLDFTVEFKRTCNFVATIRGNVVEDNAVKLSELIEANFSSIGRPVAKIQKFKRRIHQFPRGERVVKFQTFSDECFENNVFNYYQIEQSGVESRVLADILIEILRPHIEAANNVIQEKNGKKHVNVKEKAKGKKKTGEKASQKKWFHMYPRMVEHQGIVTLCMHAYGSIPAYDLGTIDKMMDQTLSSFTDVICKLTPKDFTTVRKQLMKNYGYRKSDDTNIEHLLSDLFDLYESTKDMTFRWTDDDCKADALSKLTLQDLQDWYRANLTPQSPGFRHLSIQIMGNHPTKEKPIVPAETRKEWRERRSTVRDCAFNYHHQLLHAHKPVPRDNLKLTLLSDAKGTDGTSHCDDPLYVLDIPDFKLRMFKYPTTMDN